MILDAYTFVRHPKGPSAQFQVGGIRCHGLRSNSGPKQSVDCMTRLTSEHPRIIGLHVGCLALFDEKDKTALGTYLAEREFVQNLEEFATVVARLSELNKKRIKNADRRRK